MGRCGACSVKSSSPVFTRDKLKDERSQFFPCLCGEMAEPAEHMFRAAGAPPSLPTQSAWPLAAFVHAVPRPVACLLVGGAHRAVPRLLKG